MHRLSNSEMQGFDGLTKLCRLCSEWLVAQTTMDAQQQREQLLDYGDLLKLSLAGLLREFELETWQGARKKGRQIFYGTQPAGYCTQPWENVNYASCHDNQTLFDQVHDICYASASTWCLDPLDALHGTPDVKAKCC